ncbi:MAG: hypothetical protein MUP64_16185 [Anaerolineae bacterium]|nr:hypothetical protein [Anaerolineae bacterium]
MSVEPLEFTLTPVTREEMMWSVPLGITVEFTLTPMMRVEGKLVPITPLPPGWRITDIIAPPEVLAIGKRWASIESHLIQLGLFGEEKTKDWLMGHGQTFYDWLRESLGTRV